MNVLTEMIDDDCISRRDAIDAVEREKIAHGRYTTSSYVGYENAEKVIGQLPSVQPKRGKWIKKHRHYGGFRSYTGFDAMGEQHTVTVDERVEYDDLYCSECGARSADNFLNFCPKCGADMRNCRIKGKFCVYATELGYCSFTACREATE